MNRRESIKQLIENAQKDPEFFHRLVFDAEQAIGELDYLDRSQKARLVSLRPEDLIAGLAGAVINFDDSVAQCGSSCHDSCRATCDGSCQATCASSCDTTCGSRSCDTTTNRFVDRFSNPVFDDRFTRRLGGFRRF